VARISPKKWAEMRAAYRRGEGSLRELATRFEVDRSTLERRSTKEGWEKERRQVAGAAQAKAAERDVESVAAMLGKHRAAAARVADLALTGIEKLAAKGKLTQAALERYSLILARMAPMERLASGIERAKPVAGGGGLQRRIVQRGGAAVPAVVPAPAAEKKAS
jgi:hypothetical protein